MAQALEFNQILALPVDGANWPVPLVFPVSFESGEQETAAKIYLPGKVRIVRVRGTVTKAIAGTDNGTITIKNSAGTSIAALTATASDALNTDYDSGVITPASQNDNVADSYITVTTAKSTAGGKVRVSVEFNILPNH